MFVIVLCLGKGELARLGSGIGEERGRGEIGDG